MNLIIYFILFGLCIAPLNKAHADNQLIEYAVNGDRYVVVVVMDGLSASEAKKMARTRAAEITVEQGNRYFTVDREEKAFVGQSGKGQRFYGNMYEELIIEKDFGKEHNRSNSLPNTENSPAWRLVFTMYKDKPLGRLAIDACTLTDCGK